MTADRGEPVCVFCRRKPVDPAWRPFCSERCKVQDLAKWADGAYRVPVHAEQDEHDDDAEQKEREEPED